MAATRSMPNQTREPRSPSCFANTDGLTLQATVRRPATSATASPAMVNLVNRRAQLITGNETTIGCGPSTTCRSSARTKQRTPAYASVPQRSPRGTQGDDVSDALDVGGVVQPRLARPPLAMQTQSTVRCPSQVRCTVRQAMMCQALRGRPRRPDCRCQRASLRQT